MGNWQNWLGTSARWWNIIDHSQPSYPRRWTTLYTRRVQLRILYFSMVHARDPNMFWGTLPLENGSFGGVMGAVVNGEADVSGSTWFWDPERQPHMDFVPIFFGPLVAALTPDPHQVDFAFLTRPFARRTWVGIALCVAVILLAVFVPCCALGRYEDTDAYQATATVAWTFFTLINAYYSGALTMFFASEMDLEFSKLEDVLDAYPTWKLMVLSGNEAMYVLQEELHARIVDKPGREIHRPFFSPQIS